MATISIFKPTKYTEEDAKNLKKLADTFPDEDDNEDYKIIKEIGKVWPDLKKKMKEKENKLRKEENKKKENKLRKEENK